MSRPALLGWLTALCLLVPSPVSAATSSNQSTTPVLHTRVTPPSPRQPLLPTHPVRPAPAPRTQSAAQQPAVADRLIVTFSRTDATTTSRAHAAAGATPIATLAAGKVQVVRVDPAHRDTALASYQHQPGVKAVSLDRAVSATEIPTDPLYAQQTGAGYTMGWSLDAIGAPTAWTVSHGDGVKVAVLDTGIFGTHEDLSGQVVLSQDFTGTAPSALDGNGHGTHVAGIIAALENNGLGLSGVAPRAKLVNAKVLADDGSGSMANVMSAIPWAVQQGARVINMSLGADAPCDAGLQATIDDAWNAGAVIVAAAGNHASGSTSTAEMEPANCNHVIGVAASTIGGPSATSAYSEGPAWFSNDGPSVTLAAPGDTVYSTMLTLGGELSDPTGYGALSGTSMASPQVAGTAALIWASPYGTSNEAVLNRLTSTAEAIPGTGTDWIYGRVNAAAAVGLISLPAPAQVVDGLSAETPIQQSTTTISASWSAVAGATGYVYAIGTTPGAADVAGWTDNGASLAMTQTGLSLTNGTSYYTTVHAYSGQGVSVSGTSSTGVRVLLPVSTVADGAGADLSYQAATSQLLANWAGVSPAIDYEYAVGTTAGGNDLRDWTSTSGSTNAIANNVSLAPGGTYYTSVRAVYTASQRSGATSSNGVQVLSAPGSVNASATASSSPISASWSGVTGAAGYEYAIGSSAGGTDVLGWTDSGSSASVTRGGLSLSDGHTYFVSVRAYDAVGGRTAASSSAGATVHGSNAGGGGGGGGGGGRASSPAVVSFGGGGGGGAGGAPASAPQAAAPASSAPALSNQPVAPAPSPGGPAPAPIVVSATSPDSRLGVGADSNSGVVQLTVAALPLVPTLPAPTGWLRLLDNLFGVRATDVSGGSFTPLTPLQVSVVPSAVDLAAVAGDPTQLVIGYLDASGTWTALATSVDLTGRLTARTPSAVMLAVFRQAPTFWVVPSVDLPLIGSDGSLVGTESAGSPVEIVAVQGSVYQLRMADGSLASLDGTQVSAVSAPDALPPIPVAQPQSQPQADAAPTADNTPAAADPVAAAGGDDIASSVAVAGATIVGTAANDDSLTDGDTETSAADEEIAAADA